MADALKTWQEKLAYLQQQEAISADAAQKFALRKQIQDAQERIDELTDDAHYLLPPQLIAPTKLTRGADHLFGREQELSALDQIWNDPSKKVLTIVAWGGVGKTALIFEWMARQAAKNWQGFERVFDWSFFSQGTRAEGGASADTFVAAALRFFGDEAMADSSASAWDKGARLAQLISQQRSLLVLDGIEPLQHPPGPLAGELKDPALATLLKGLARQNSGLCIVTTRERVADLAASRATTAPEWELHQLSGAAGVELLKNLSVRGIDPEFEEVVIKVRGHALTLNLLGRYLAKAHQGDIRKHDQVKFEKADAKVQGGYAFKTIGAYENWFSQGGEDGARALALLRLLGLFDRPADSGCLNALRTDPSIEGLTDLLTGLDDAEWNIAVASLADCGLVSIQSNPATIRSSQSAIDAHPLIREYFAKQLKVRHLDSWRAAHRRLYEYLRDSTNEGDEPTLEDLQPLYQAVVHGCQAGLQQEACDKVYFARISRGNQGYAVNELGAFGADLGVVASFFETPWVRVSPALTELDQAWMLSQAAYHLRALGRLTEALEPMRKSGEMVVKVEKWQLAAISYSNLSELELTLGEVNAAIRDAAQSVTYADLSGDAFQRWSKRETLSDAQLQAGCRDESVVLFREAEQMQAEAQPEYPMLYSLGGFRYCDLLLVDAERAAWQATLKAGVRSQKSVLLNACHTVAIRAAQTLEWVTGRVGVLSVAFDHLTLARAGLYQAVLEWGATFTSDQLQTDDAVSDDNERRTSLNVALQSATSRIDTAVASLRRASSQHQIPRGLLTRAWLRRLDRNDEGAQADLDEAWEIAERGPMKLFMADIHLYRARLFGRMEDEGGRMKYPWDTNPDGSPRGPLDDLRAARTLIEQCGYWRRKEELEDAEEAAKNW